MPSPQVAAQECTSAGPSAPALESYPSREAELGALKIRRALPIKGKRMVGTLCFLDRYGPHTFAEGKPMDVAPHPHIGLQTVTWLLAGEVLHTDSLGSESMLQPGGVNVMTSGGGIAHAEETPPRNSGLLNGVQLWTALPEAQRKGAASFQCVERVPQCEPRGGIVQVFAGALLDQVSPAPHFSQILGADLQVHAGSELCLPLDPGFEHALLLLSGDAEMGGQSLSERDLYYLGVSRAQLALRSRGGARILLIGGPPFPEPILIWWNFVARTPEEIAEARADWEQGSRFGEVKAYKGPRLHAPNLLRLARPNPAS